MDTNNPDEVQNAQEIGAFKRTPPSIKDGDKEPSPNQRLAAGFASRLQTSGAIIDEVGDQFTGFFDRAAGITPQGLKSEDRQRFEQAERNFINAALRRESGASIQQSEFDSARQQYIPQPGDSPELLAQKKQNRDTLTQALILESGAAFDQLQGSVPQTVLVNNKPMTVGATVTNDKGQKGRVNQDGTITVLE